MAIKDQCLNCKHYSADICGKTSTTPVFNSSSCPDYSRRILLEKKEVPLVNLPNSSIKPIIQTPNSANPITTTTNKQKMFSHLLSFDGRIRRLEYGISFIIYYCIAFITGGIASEIGSDSSYAICGIIILLEYAFIISQSVKRCHDLGLKGWWIFLPIFNPFYLLFAVGESGPNKYGINPKGE